VRKRFQIDKIIAFNFVCNEFMGVITFVPMSVVSR